MGVQWTTALLSGISRIGHPLDGPGRLPLSSTCSSLTKPIPGEGHHVGPLAANVDGLRFRHRTMWCTTVERAFGAFMPGSTGKIMVRDTPFPIKRPPNK